MEPGAEGEKEHPSSTKERPTRKPSKDPEKLSLATLKVKLFEGHAACNEHDMKGIIYRVLSRKYETKNSSPTFFAHLEHFPTLLT